MRRDNRKQPWQTFPFWFLILSGMALTAAWKLDLLRPQVAAVSPEQELIEEESAPDWASEAIVEETLAQVEEQSEPISESDSPRSFPEGTDSGLTIAPSGDDSAAASSSEAADPETSLPQSPNEVNPFSRTDARLVSAHREQTPPQSLNSAKTAPTRTPSPFGPAHVEFHGTRHRKSTGTPAENATWAEDPDIEDAAASSEVVQTAAVDSTDPTTARAAKPSPAPARSAATNEPIDLTAIDQLMNDGEDVEANFQLSNLYWKRPEVRKQIMSRLQIVSNRIYFAPQPHYMDGHVVRPGDLMQNIAQDYDVSWEYLAKLNRISDAKKIRPGQKLKVIRGPFAAVVDLSDMELTIHSHGHYVHAFPIGIGQDNPSPIGSFKVVEKLNDPTYYGAEGVIDHEDTQNPLGEYLIDLGDSYGIHGTNDETLIGKSESKGCIRMQNIDIADVYDLLTPGSEVLIRR